MSEYVFAPPATPGVPVEGTSALFPVRRILCVGRNYAAHRVEMGGDDREPPFFFTKPADAIVTPGHDVPYPSATQNLHHEVELVAALGAGGADLALADAMNLVFGYAVGVDLTRRDLQNAAKDKGHPWDASKGFDAAAPIGTIRPAGRAGDIQGAIRLTVNGKTRQSSSVANMIWSLPEIIVGASRLWTLAAGDLIYTGTPEGVGPLVRGDVVHGEIEAVGAIDFTIR